MKKKQLIGLVCLSLLIGAGLAGGVYVVSTPTKIAPKAASPVLINQLSTVKPQTEPTIPSKKTPTETELSEQAIISAFGTTTTEFDLNQDGAVNSLDILEFRKTH